MHNEIIERPYGALLYSESLTESASYVNDRRHGRIKSFRTPWSGFNRAGINGLEWGSILTIGARPGSGKTLIASQILRESRRLNPDQDFNILEFQFEMGPKQSGSRAFAAELALDYNQVLSTDKSLDDFTFDRIQRLIRETKDLESKGVWRLQINKPINHKEMLDAIRKYYVALGSKPLLITIDHSWLIKKAPDEKEKFSTLYNTVEALMELKNELPIIIIMLTQLNRTIDEASRKTPGNIGNYPVSADVFGGDALMQGSDMLIALNRPYKSNIFSYGPRKYEVKDDYIFMHLLKIRNGSDKNDILFMQADFRRQQLLEVPEFHSTGGNNNAANGNGYTPYNSTVGQNTFTT
jgi:replicative DNA helicase